jgi:flagellar biosynthesis/type III secretory pathway M-ring protein FliF/YscJ
LDVVAFLVVLLLLAAVVAIVSRPLRAGREEDPREEGADVAALEAARDAKYREIRDAELDYRTGKLSEEDWRGLDEQLRAEAAEILRQLDRVRGA